MRAQEEATSIPDEIVPMPDLPSHSPASPQETAAGRPDAADAAFFPLSFIVCVSDQATLQANLLASPCLGPNSPEKGKGDIHP
jgi:hypothetical protein